MRHEFDLVGGYSDYHAFCRRQRVREVPAGSPPLLRRGYEVVSAIDAEAAAELRRRIEANFECAVARRKSQHLRVYAIDDEEFRRALLGHVMSAELDDRALRFFESEYFVHELEVTRATPIKKLRFNSFRWHCDRGPRMHLKLLLYLNDFEEHEGNTEFLDLECTGRIAATGYLYAPVRTRRTDLSELAERVGAPYAPWSSELRAGEGIVFQPGSVLHRGLLPTRGSRFVVTVCLQPSPIPWRDALDRAIPKPAGGDPRWHEHASVLQAALAGDASLPGRNGHHA
jgi:hypothetical protein